MIEELARIPSPAPKPNSLAHDGRSLWIGSWETGRVYGIDAVDGNVFEEFASPGKPVGSTVARDELRFVISENGAHDNRFVRRFVPGRGFESSDAFACPDDTGSHLAFDGEHLWLSQRFNKCALELDAPGNPTRSLDIGEQPLGMTWCGERLYFALWLGKDRGGSHLGYVEPLASEPTLRIVGQFDFVAVALASAGDRLFTNDNRGNAVVAFARPA